MPPPRFAQKEHLSYRNLLAIPAKKEAQFSEIPVLTTGSDSEDLIVATSQYWITKHTTRPGKLANKTVSLSACSGSISDFTACPFDKLLAVASESGETSIFSLPERLNPPGDTQSFNCTRKLHSDTKNSPIDKLAFHSNSRGILAGSIGSQLAIWDAEHLNDGSPSINLTSGTRMWDIKWSWDGRLLGGTTRTGILQLWDPRDSTMVASCDNQDGSGGRKCSRIAWIGDHILTTSVNKLRDRQYSVYDPRSLSSPIKTERIDNSNGTLIPLVDPNRFQFYVTGGPSCRYRNGADQPSTVDVMKTELCKFMVLTKNAEVIPLTMQAPKRQYLYFHADVMPPVRSMEPAQIGQEWLQGKDQSVALLSQDPAASGGAKSFLKSTSDSVTSQPIKRRHRLNFTASQLPTMVLPLTASKNQSNQSLVIRSHLNQRRAPSLVGLIHQSRISPSGFLLICTASRTEQSHVSKPVRWSRKYVNGQTSMQAEYEDLHNLSATFPADREMIKCTSNFFLVPIGGPGGRLGVYHLMNKGRLPTRLPCLINEANIVAFEVDQLDQGRVYVAGEDGKVRIFRVPEHGLEEDSLNAELILSTSGMERINLIKPHPTAQDILLTISDDMNKPCVRLWYVGKTEDSSKPFNEIQLPSGAVSSASWSLDGSKLAVANKAKLLQVTWTDDRSHILTSGFSSTGMREVKFYRVDYEQHVIESLSQISFDNSPAAFFIHFDPDTSIGFCWSKGERTTYLIELLETKDPSANPAKSTYKFDRLTPFVHSTIQLGYSFFIKQVLDIKAIEVAKALRLTGNQVEVVSFKIPRNREEFFQDDVFCDTRDLLNPIFKNGHDWLTLGESDTLEGGGDVQERELIDGIVRINLQPVGMSKLSQAPLTKAQSNQKSLIAKGPQLTDSQKADQYLDKLFQSAKRDDNHTPGSTQSNLVTKPEQDDDDEEVVGRSRVGAPVDDDW
ncbi:hypothetical protein KEM48_011566 [Puccinia striiformis f. sp. tritici PST-130]|nr:hypothetical protein KEM48_011566 [Puccinia striiformis f. sp. tritici PST-130]